MLLSSEVASLVKVRKWLVRLLKFRVGEDLKESDCAVVHGVVKTVSPVKTSKAGEPYYQFYLADGKKMVKGVGYKDSLFCQEELSKMKSKPVALVNCTIKRCLFDRDEREVSVQKRTRLESSKMEMVDESASICEEEITVDAAKVKDLKAGQYVALMVKVMSVKPVTQVRTSIGKILDCQNVKVADKSGCVRVTFWNEDVDKVKEGFSVVEL
jgi:DNA polymerase III alpha subunit (gram-positive type)